LRAVCHLGGAWSGRGGPRGGAGVPRSWKRGAYAASCVASMLACAGCIPPEPRGLDSPDPSARLAAISEAGVRGDEAAIPDLIEQLESNDPGARMLSIRALERITGQTLGYDHADPWWVRAPAVERWKRWASGRGLIGAAPGSESVSSGGSSAGSSGGP